MDDSERFQVKKKSGIKLLRPENNLETNKTSYFARWSKEKKLIFPDKQVSPSDLSRPLFYLPTTSIRLLVSRALTSHLDIIWTGDVFPGKKRWIEQE